MVQKDLKDVFSQLAVGVTLITIGSEESPYAMTATAFMPLSLDPPLILVAIEKKNETHHIFCSSRSSFGVSLLSAAQQPISDRYSSKDLDRYHFKGVDTFTGPSGSVLIAGSSAALEAELSEQHDAGDHTIFIGKIIWAQADTKNSPLVYWQRGYHSLD
jgi:flavin reductase (DIM6/NTAB) family NADH-FMN oxidoreductase RutF